jgi:rhodanese-related sulfurtransferase
MYWQPIVRGLPAVLACLVATAACADSAVISATDLGPASRRRPPTSWCSMCAAPRNTAPGTRPARANLLVDELERRIAELADARERDLVVYCKGGKRAMTALELLARAGFQRLAHLDGDIVGWSDGGRPVATVEPSGTPATH